MQISQNPGLQSYGHAILVTAKCTQLSVSYADLDAPEFRDAPVIRNLGPDLGPVIWPVTLNFFNVLECQTWKREIGTVQRFDGNY